VRRRDIADSLASAGFLLLWAASGVLGHSGAQRYHFRGFLHGGTAKSTSAISDFGNDAKKGERREGLRGVLT